MIKYAVAASGGGSNFQAAIDAQEAGKIPYGKIVALLSDKVDSGALERARKHDIPAHFVDHTVSQEQRDAALLEILRGSGAQFLMLTGYLKKISPAILDELPVYNIHPALDLHKFGGKGMYGMNVHTAVIVAGEKYSGATLHRATAIYDDPEQIIMQTPPIGITKKDTPETLQQKVLVAEHLLIPKFLDKLTRDMTKEQKSLQNK
jgi:phosphoribosylglycinamide formyltransferase-1